MKSVPVPTSHYFHSHGLEMHYLLWGEKTKPAVVLWHGLARSCRDFDVLAASLSADFCVVVPDTIGRGLSQWSASPSSQYCFSFYAQLVEGLVGSLGIQRFSWVGTSMGGALGIRVAAGPLGPQVDRLILNDMGPEPNAVAMTRIRNYIGSPPQFDTVSQFETYCKEIYRPFGWHSDEQWRHMAQTSLRRLPSGQITCHYDPEIVRQLTDHPDDFTQWDAFDQISAPMLLLRGVDSDLVLPEHVAAMKQHRANLEVVEIEGCGHAPALNVPAQLSLVHRFLVHAKQA